MPEFVEISRPTAIPFDWKDPLPGGQNLGRAEFMVCLKWRRGKLAEYWVDPVQTRLPHGWHFTIGPSDRRDFYISAYEGLTPLPGAWLHFWCREHKTTSFRVYAPPGAKYLVLQWGGLEFWRTVTPSRCLDVVDVQAERDALLAVYGESSPEQAQP